MSSTQKTETESETVLDLQVVPVMVELFEGDFRYRVAHGGRGSMKSWTFARRLLLSAIEEENPEGLSYLCCRELQKSIKDSVHKLLINQIKMMGLEDYFDWGTKYLRCRNGVEFLFYGLRMNAEEIKSLEGVKICWVEEAQKVRKSSWKVLDPTIRMEGSEIWVSFNPELQTDPTSIMFIENPPPNAIVREVNWYHNPWFSKVLDDQRLHMMRTDPDAYAHVWEGKYLQRSDAQVLGGKYMIDVFDSGEESGEWFGPYYGGDWGFSQDPTALVRMWIREFKDEIGNNLRYLYIDQEAWGIRVELDDIGELFDNVEGSRAHTIRADNSRPETISHVSKQGFNVVAADKWPGSVEDGIAYLRAFDMIVIHQDCPRTAEEARLYAHKIDKLTGDILPDIVDKHNHCWDAVRYGLQPMIKQYMSEITEAHAKQIERSEKDTEAPRMEETAW